jgi:hypothetical protein
MIEIEFILNDQIKIVRCNENERLRDIYEKLDMKTHLNINSVNFLYNNDKINDKLSINQFIKEKNKNKTKKFVNTENKQNSNIKRKEISCPQCGKSIKIKIKDYKIMLYDCKNGHKINKILLDEFAKTQQFKEPDIQCKNCRDKNNIEQIYYRCYKCKINLCHFCYSIHNQTHKIVNCDQNNYICSVHGDRLCSFCKSCKLNICNLCKNKHNFHEIVDFINIIPNKELIIKNKTELKENIELFHNNITDIIN